MKNFTLLLLICFAIPLFAESVKKPPQQTELFEQQLYQQLLRQHALGEDNNLEKAIPVDANHSSQIKIIGGQLAPLNQRKWQVALLWNKPGTNYENQFCGGSLVSTTWVLTAAHCLADIKQSDVKILYGTNNLIFGGNTVNVEKIIIHEAYNNVTNDNDIALIKLSKPAMSSIIQILPKDQENTLSPQGAAALVLGWGNTIADAASRPDLLMEVVVPVVNFDECKSAYEKLNALVTKNMLCAGFKVGGKDSCQGDSGGPLLVSNLRDGFYLAGIVSWGVGCAEPGQYGVYTRVVNFSDWITKVMSS